VGLEFVLEEPMAQDDTVQEDLSLRSDPGVALGAAVHEFPPYQIPPMEDRIIAVGSAADCGGSASQKPFDERQLVEI